MPEVDINLRRNDPNARKDLVQFWNEVISYSDERVTIIPTFDRWGKPVDLEQDVLIPLGKNEEGKYVLYDIHHGIHILAGGSMLSGLGMFRRTSLLHIIKKYSPTTVQCLLLDTINQMSDFDDASHLRFPRSTKTEDCIKQLQWCYEEMNRRFAILEKSNGSYKSIADYNQHKKDEDELIPTIIIFISELGDIMDHELGERSLVRIAQMSRAVSMYFIITTQRPSEQTLTSLIKANIPQMIAFQMPYEEQSRLFIGESGAETLLGQGDMLFKCGWDNTILHLQGLYFPVDETKDMVKSVQ
jgi:DNA segregation ATPase FtsK/SpoIIIE, S-DNA-T family